ncbi:hypothetical protein SJZ84_01660 [Hafnia paralvei]|uniref:hypothetical protein n=1 Tax=Hafnia TaxID=568 RepID=UPI001034C2D3|nr:hypothetical protein [Hafnia paralvei]MDX6839701.1 hypothetical protein [Hafnia paralvei]MDX6909532.1 hypothetical protein [Hafnia paralvei]TBM14299.1 hypothetical protein EYY86_11960 [Hafnia paralvei]
MNLTKNERDVMKRLIKKDYPLNIITELDISIGEFVKIKDSLLSKLELVGDKRLNIYTPYRSYTKKNNP